MRSLFRNPSSMDVLEVKRTLAGAVHTFPCRAAELTPRRAVLLHTLRHPGRVDDLTLPTGTVTVAYYWADRPYNVYHWIAPSGDTLAYYFNLSGPVRIADSRVEWEDLAVDVLVTPDQRVRVLDEDQIPETAAGRAPEIARARERVLREWGPVVREVQAASRTFLARGAGTD